MRRADLRKSKNLEKDFITLCQNLAQDEVCTVLFEIGDFSFIDRSFELCAQENTLVMNSLKFNQVDWMMVLKANK